MEGAVKNILAMEIDSATESDEVVDVEIIVMSLEGNKMKVDTAVLAEDEDKTPVCVSLEHAIKAVVQLPSIL